MFGDDRAQTTIDFAIGIGIFMLAVTFVVAFVPGILDPFTGGQDNPLAADRAATRLTEDVLASPDEPFLLDAACTEAFFNETTPGGCGFDEDWVDGSNDYLNDALGFDALTSLNVTVQDDSGIVSVDGDGDGDESDLRVGSRVPDSSESVVIAQRSVWLDGGRYRLFVRVW